MDPWLARGIVAVWGVVLLGVSTEAAETQEFRVPAGQRQLFVDDYGVAEIHNLVHTLHQPDKKGAVIRPDPSIPMRVVQTRSAPIWDPAMKRYRFWDLSTPSDLHSQQLYCGAYHESTDGLHWEQPIVGQIEHRGSRDNNFVTVVHNGRHGRLDCVVYVPDDPEKPLKGLSFIGDVLWPFVSADGKNWQVVDTQSLPTADEFNLSYDAVEKQYLATVKTFTGYGRSVGLFTSRDFAHWTSHGMVFQADDEDQKRGHENIKRCFADPKRKYPEYNIPEKYNVDVYNMGLFRYESCYLSMPSMFHQTGKVGKDWPGFDPMTLSDEVRNLVRMFGDWTGFHHVQLVCTRDLHNWTRLGDRQPFLDLSPVSDDAYDTQVIMPPSSAVVHGDELWFYYTAVRSYGTISGDLPDQGAICLAVLRRDGFVSLDAQGQPGTVLTQPFIPPAGALHVNADMRAGKLHVELLDADGKCLARSAPLTGDLLRSRVTWAEGDPAVAAGQPIRLQFTLESGQLYSYWFE